MDVRCEKCQTEYELDEARLKPSGVTVKCTQCGHMFKIRKRAITNVGAPPASEPRQRPSSSKQPVGDATVVRAPSAAELSALEKDDTTVDRDRNWLIRLDNGEQRTCRELAALQQWIVAGAVTRESLISRTGKTWKRLGDITELMQYFSVADEARTRRPPTNEPATKQIDIRSTMMGVAVKASSAGGTILPDDDEPSTTGNYRPTPASMPPPPGARTPPMGVSTKPPVNKPATKAPPIPAVAQKPKPTSINETLRPPSINQTLAALPPPPQLLASAPPAAPTVPIRTTPPPAPRAAAWPAPAPASSMPAPPVVPAPVAYAETVPSPTVPQPPTLPRATPAPPEASMTGLPSLKGAPPAGNRATAAWATEAIRDVEGEGGGGPSGPIGGRLGAIPDEPAFAGRVRAEPTDASIFSNANVRTVFDDDDDVLPSRRGSKAGLILAIGSLVVIAGAVAVVYLYVLRDQTVAHNAPARDAAVAVATPDASTPVVTPLVDAAPPPPADPLAAARSELAGDVEPRLHSQLDSLAGKDDPASQAVRARLDLALAEDLADHANLVADRGEAERLRRDSGNLVIDALPLAQHAVKGDPASADANLAMAEVLRLQNKPAGEVKRFADKARAADPRDAALTDALVLVRDHKLDAAHDALAAIDQGDNRLEASGDVRARLHLALLALAADKPADAKPLVDQILAAKPEHVVARALAAKLDTVVARTNPLPPEDHGEHGDHHGTTTTHPTGTTPPALPTPSDEASYDALMAQARKVADSNCSKAMELYQKALDIKPSSVEALTGEAYCHLDAKEFSQAYTLFHAALLYSSHYEPALQGVAELYQQQGNKERAIEAWQVYLAAYPGSAKAQKNLELLGAAAGGTPPQGSAATPPPAPAPAPPPAPTPAPAPAAPSDGSAS